MNESVKRGGAVEKSKIGLEKHVLVFRNPNSGFKQRRAISSPS